MRVGDAESNCRGAGKDSHAFVGGRMVVRRLGWPVAEDPLRLPPVAGKELVDAGRISTFLVGEVFGVVDEGIGGIGDQSSRTERVACNLGHFFPLKRILSFIYQ